MPSYTWAGWMAGLGLRLRRRSPFQPPRKALILKPCCLSHIMLATPLLAALSQAYPQAQFDWALCDWARPAIAGNPRVSHLIPTGRVGMPGYGRADVAALIRRLRAEGYDSCFVPSRSSLLAYVAWRAGIPQRVGLNLAGRGLAHTIPVHLPEQTRHEAEVYLSLARAIGLPGESAEEFYPADRERAVITRLLADELDWMGDVPLVVIHPGGGHNPWQEDRAKLWPLERWALVANRLVRRGAVRLVLAGAESDRSQTRSLAGMVSGRVHDLAGRLSLGELGALCEMADLYLGNDAGPSHVAAAVGCATVVVFGPSSPDVSAPYVKHGRVACVATEARQPFSWEQGATVEAVVQAVEGLLAAWPGRWQRGAAGAGII